MLFQIPISGEYLTTSNIVDFEGAHVAQRVVWVIKVLVGKPEMPVSISLGLESYETIFLL